MSGNGVEGGNTETLFTAEEAKEAKLIADSANKMIDQIQDSISTDQEIENLEKEIGFIEQRISATQDPLKKAYQDLQVLKKEELLLRQEIKPLKGEINKLKDEVAKNNRLLRKAEKEAQKADEGYKADPSPLNKEILEAAKLRAAESQDKLSGKENELQGKQQLLNGNLEKSKKAKSDISEKDPAMHQHMEKESEERASLEAKKAAASNRHSPKGVLNAKRENASDAKERKSNLSDKMPTIKEGQTGEELLGAMVMWLLMMLLAMLGGSLNKKSVERAENRLSNMKPLLEDMAKIVDKKNKLDKEIEEAKKNPPTLKDISNASLITGTTAEDAKNERIERMEAESKEMGQGLEGYEKQIKKVALTKQTRNQINRDAAEYAEKTATEYREIFAQHKKELADQETVLKSRLGTEEKALQDHKDDLKKKPELKPEDKAKTKELEEARDKTMKDLAAVQEQKKNAEKQEIKYQDEVNKAQKDIEKISKKEEKLQAQKGELEKVKQQGTDKPQGGLELGKTPDANPRQELLKQQNDIQSEKTKLRKEKETIEAELKEKHLKEFKDLDNKLESDIHKPGLSDKDKDDRIMAHTEKKHELIVRQENELTSHENKYANEEAKIKAKEDDLKQKLEQSDKPAQEKAKPEALEKEKEAKEKAEKEAKAKEENKEKRKKDSPHKENEIKKKPDAKREDTKKPDAPKGLAALGNLVSSLLKAKSNQIESAGGGPIPGNSGGKDVGEAASAKSGNGGGITPSFNNAQANDTKLKEKSTFKPTIKPRSEPQEEKKQVMGIHRMPRK